jgi:hypothetical protein
MPALIYIRSAKIMKDHIASGAVAGAPGRAQSGAGVKGGSGMSARGARSSDGGAGSGSATAPEAREAVNAFCQYTLEERAKAKRPKRDTAAKEENDAQKLRRQKLMKFMKESGHTSCRMRLPPGAEDGGAQQPVYVRVVHSRTGSPQRMDEDEQRAFLDAAWTSSP